MATDFFQRQSDARRSTLWLVTMFCLAVIGIVGTVTAVAYAVVQSQMREPGTIVQHPEQVLLPLVAGVGTLLVILGGSLYKIADLQSGGGTRVAENLGGRRIYPNTQDPLQRRLLNVVEEMAIASGTPVPPVFLMDEDGINAFAAGYSPSDAVLGVTRGCIEQLSRDELQGVIAHEFSHVLNGDMRMSIRLIGILNGILLLGLMGHFVFRTFLYTGAGRSRRSEGNSGGQAIIVIFAIALTLVVLGFIGTFFGNLIKAAVSRQREYLADASAVQFTRNPSGIANALKRIGAASAGSKLKTPAAAEASHMYFAQGVWEGISGLWATHPPLPKRILAIEPSWDGKFPAERVSSLTGAASSTEKQAPGSELAAGLVGASQGAVEEVPVEIVDNAVHQVGEPTLTHRHYATDLIANLPDEILWTTRDPYGARAIIYALLMDADQQVRRDQQQVLATRAQPDVQKLVVKIQDAIDRLDTRARLPLVDLSLPALCSMSASQYADFHQVVNQLAKADKQIDLFEWMLWQVLMRHLRPHFEKVKSPRIKYYGLQRLQSECSSLISIVATAGNSDSVARASFQRGAQHLPELNLIQQARSRRALEELGLILEKLNKVSAKQRGRIVDACAATICADEHVTWQEAELLRGIADLLDCPMPPLLVRA